MPALDWIRMHPLSVSASVGALAGILIGLFLPIRAASPTQAQQDAWALPDQNAIARFKDGEYRQVRGARIWGGAAAGQGSARSVQWRLFAIVTQPGPRVAVSVANAKPVWIKLGDSLPDGARLVGINRDGIWYEKDGCRALRRLYATGQPAAAEACADNTPAPAAAQPAAPVPGGTAPTASSTSGSKSSP